MLSTSSVACQFGIGYGLLLCTLIWSDAWLIDAPSRAGLTQEVKVEVCDWARGDYDRNRYWAAGIWVRVETRVMMGEVETAPWEIMGAQRVVEREEPKREETIP